jgi:hypothetical protein
MFWRKKGGMYGLISCIVLWVIVAVIAVFSKGIMYAIAIGISFAVSVFLSFQFKFLFLKTKLGKKWIKEDHQGSGCMILAVAFICLMSLFVGIAKALVLE